MIDTKNETKSDVVFPFDITLEDVFRTLNAAEEIFETENYRTQTGESHERLSRLRTQYTVVDGRYKGFLELTTDFMRARGQGPENTIMPAGIQDDILALEVEVERYKVEKWFYNQINVVER